jgi:hypothetical protein
LFCCVGYLRIWEFPFLILLLYIVTTRVIFRLLTTWFFMNELSILRLIVILLIIILNMTPLLCILFLLLCRLQIFLPNRILFLTFVFLVGNLLIFVAVTSWVWWEILRNIYIYLIFFIKRNSIFSLAYINLFVFRLK